MYVRNNINLLTRGSTFVEWPIVQRIFFCGRLYTPLNDFFVPEETNASFSYIRIPEFLEPQTDPENAIRESDTIVGSDIGYFRINSEEKDLKRS